MSISQLSNKKVAVFGTEATGRGFINFLKDNEVSVLVIDDIALDYVVDNDNLIKFLPRNEVEWSDIECLITNQDDTNLIELAQKNECHVFSIIEFFIKYFSEYNYIGLVGESGSSISSDILKYLFCKMKLNIDYDICRKEKLFTLYEFGKTSNYIFELNQKDFSALKSPHFNNLIIFDLEYNRIDIDKVRLMLLNQDEEDLTIMNIDNRDVKELYNSIKDDGNHKSKIIPISIKKILKDGISFVNNEIYLNSDEKSDEFLTNEFKNLDGEQNKINILSVFALMVSIGYQPQEVIENLYNFKACDNVFELVLHKENFTFINDVKNKNKLQSLISFDNIYWILCIDEIDFEFSEFLQSVEYFNKIKYAFIIGKYNEEILEIFRNNGVEYFIMYNMENVFIKIKSLMEEERKEEKITILLSSINDISDNEFYGKCSEDFEKLVNKGE